MRKLFTSCFFAFTLAANANTQALDNIVVDDFETGAVSFTEQVNPLPNADEFLNEVVQNPSKTAANNSNYAWKFTRVGNAGPNWGGMWATLTNEIPKSYHRVEVKYYRTNSTSRLRINLEGGSGKKEFLPVTNPTKINEWETLVFDLVENGVSSVRVIGFQPDFIEPVTADAVTYIDDIKFIYDPTVTTPDTQVLFSDSGDGTFFDQSWVNVTAPSVFAQVEGHNEKIPAVTDIKKSGENSLKLTWKSAIGGDWMALTASIGWKSFELTEMEDIRMWVYSPVALAKGNLPKVWLEASTGGTTGKLPLGNYLTTDLAAATWTEVIIPITDLKTISPDFAKWDAIKGVFFGQNIADNSSHTLYVDDISFNKNGGASSIGQVAAELLNVSYSDGVLSFGQAVKGIEIYDLSGRLIVKESTENDSFTINLLKGIYFVKTNASAFKVLVK